MNVFIFPSKIKGVVSAPSSKSITHRSIIAAALASGTSVLENVLLSDDTNYTISALKKFGVKIEQKGNILTVVGSKGNLIAPREPIDVGNSGTTLRLLCGIATIARGITAITGEKRLLERPIKGLLTALENEGIKAQLLHNNGLSITGGTLHGGKITIDGSVSSQYISSLLLIAPFAKEDITLVVSGSIVSKPYIDMTIQVMKDFGVEVKQRNNSFLIQKGQSYRAKAIVIAGDFSSASYFFASAAVTSGKVTVKNLNVNSKQGDKYFLSILKKMGCRVMRGKNQIKVYGAEKLTSIEEDMQDFPDIVQTVAVCAAFSKGKTVLKNISHLRHKETDRIKYTVEELRKTGIKVEETKDTLVIHGGDPHGAIINTHNDHRMAMAMSVLGLGAKGKTEITNAVVVNKSFPDFYKELALLGAKIKAQKDNIVLIGMRGSGKSTIGRILAKKLHKSYVETDFLIECQVGKPIEQIVKEKGWGYFREVEKEIICSVSTMQHTIVASGGGVIESEENMKQLSQNGNIVLLSANIETLLGRIDDDKNRPSLTGKISMKDDLSSVYKKRKALYEKWADVAIDTKNKTPVQIAKLIQKEVLYDN